MSDQSRIVRSTVQEHFRLSLLFDYASIRRGEYVSILIILMAVVLAYSDIKNKGEKQLFGWYCAYFAATIHGLIISTYLMQEMRKGIHYKYFHILAYGLIHLAGLVVVPMFFDNSAISYTSAILLGLDTIKIITALLLFRFYNPSNQMNNPVTDYVRHITAQRAPDTAIITQQKVSKLTEADMTFGKECSVCLDEIGTDQDAKTLPCRHYFHINCIDQWLLHSYVCPLCRHDIRQPYEEV